MSPTKLRQKTCPPDDGRHVEVWIAPDRAVGHPIDKEVFECVPF